MSSTTTSNNASKSYIEENEENEEFHQNPIGYHRSSFVPRQISFSQRQATLGEIILVLLPYFILLVDIFIFFLLRGFKLT
ncbi:unnamed protein product [Rotaria sp. Silwood1]|nr:unnamed protein product [Rotaria sp. Silwood1]CAF1265100.1 unnamed protein product [Rotaria sp. Silwood1]CAF1267043.1 unnamed protein product [Rotaria sp. Silwood1]CAF3480590.1 unnamed protein product [Rotaria sp. Silwood1]CAF3521084.1 unnamed protein product [Rotaria sp. Silwood1]